MLGIFEYQLRFLKLAQSLTAAPKYAAPCSVRLTRRVVMARSRVPSCCSSRLIALLTADCVIPRSVAARTKLRRSATFTKIANVRRSCISYHLQ